MLFRKNTFAEFVDALSHDIIDLSHDLLRLGRKGH